MSRIASPFSVASARAWAARREAHLACMTFELMAAHVETDPVASEFCLLSHGHDPREVILLCERARFAAIMERLRAALAEPAAEADHG
ncbi:MULTISPECIES: hypothetical protein [unclassified Bradyrhizobium]|uniref:hypothetical protein n=1 Tax=unclassified Bradyrhizobium TaxID=2631580 RepID=UPI00291605C5|nr:MULTISPECIES: hypothetical protein [unclassified Bradyrhizobium]